MSLEEELETAAMALIDGSPYGPLLAQKIQRTCNDTLRRLKIRGQVKVHGGGRFVVVHVRQGPTVQTVHLTLE